MGWNLLQNFECAEDLLERTTDFSETARVMLLRTPGLSKSFPTPNRYGENQNVNGERDYKWPTRDKI